VLRKRFIGCLAVLLLLIGLPAACATPEPGETALVSPQSQTVARSVLSTPTVAPTATTAPTPQPSPTPLPAPVRLVVLHTNDNWGGTEPCG